MEVTLLGCGQMGRGAAHALARDPRTSGITLVDRDRDRAAGLARWLDGTGRRVRVADDLAAALPGCAAVAAAVPWSATRAAVAEAAAAGVPLASITRPPTEELADLHAAADGRVPVLLPIGLEPGLTELVATDVARRIVELTGEGPAAVEVRCGGVPHAPRPPWGYTAFFGGELANHLPVAQRAALAVAGGAVVEHPRFSGVEQVAVPGVGTLEAYHDGMVPWLAEHPALAGADCTQKTLRWPGFAAAVTGLADLGLLDERPLEVDGVSVAPKRVVEHVLAPRLRAGPDDRDLVVLDVVGRGRPDAEGRVLALRALLVDRQDPATGLPAMARTTGFTLAWATAALAEGAVAGTGWVRPHLATTPQLFTRLTADLAALGVRWSSDGGDTAPASPGAAGTGGAPR
ncbi:saccharopine dehydrogenase family protein [Actinokineospora bangkokensis]|uniref:Saccharopine dehydrogenase-like C-terminal domain-containing protein n=1 Tax=Actinokineospora bangkokensis TaxID=1193682 RepID=A0A1Q9LJR5_9PSEU|nr:saccharopine dehydrogenase C-terminal domain-containing protein [Actinokineospora bangkokensis]OLR92243.1 hypothetical protein BJP25_23275 [Actinokineospora bangkokensis]